MEGKRTLVKMDLKGYSDIASDIEHMTGPTGVSRFHSKIRELLEDIINQIGKEKGKIIKQEGDSSLISFLTANDAHIFAKLVHQNLARWSLSLKFQKDEILYRIGCSTGVLDVSTHDGCLNTVAYRLEPKAPPGGTLIDAKTYDELSPEFQVEYDLEEIIPGKRKEKYRARRWLCPSKRNSEIVNRILEIPQIPNTQVCSYEVVTLNDSGEESCRDFQDFDYLTEVIDNQEIRLMIIPGGEYGMGSSQRSGHSSERPKHLVKVPAFLMSQFPITKAQWRVVAEYPQIKCSLNKLPSRSGSMNSPVVNVSWHDALEFCDRLSRKTGYSYRLPTEAEWEYACRAGTETPFHFGETITSQYVNYDATIKYRAEPQGVYRKHRTSMNELEFPNPFGLFDMHGNVWEWCLDHWHNTYDLAPSDGQAWLDNESSLRVVRGGSWNCEPHLCTSFHRYSHNESDSLSKDVGFRVVRSICT